MESSAAVEQAIERQMLSIYGFADFTAERMWAKGSSGVLNPNFSFYIGNLNVYLDAQLAENWRSLSEIRFTYLPNGSPDFNSGVLERTAAIDYADSFGTMRTGSIEIERAWIEYSPLSWLSISRSATGSTA